MEEGPIIKDTQPPPPKTSKKKKKRKKENLLIFPKHENTPSVVKPTAETPPLPPKKIEADLFLPWVFYF